MSLRTSAPRDGAQDPSLLGRAAAALRNHVRTWQERYIEMRVEAVEGDR